MMEPLTSAEWSALAVSLRVAACVVLVGLPVSLPIAWVLSRRQFPGKTLVETLVSLPLVLPPVVVGFALLALFGQRGWFGSWTNALAGPLVFDWKGAVLAATLMSLPLMVRALRIGFDGVDIQLEQAARTLGASRWTVFWRITVPLARSGLIAAIVLGFARSLGEFGATMVFAGNIPGRTQTIPLLIYSELESPGAHPAGLRMALLSVLIAAAALFVANLSERRVPRDQQGTGAT